MTIRTLVEVRGGRVSIVEDGNETQVTITRDDQAETASLSGQLYTEAENQALEAQVKELKAQLETATLMAREFNTDRETERQRADENRAWAERTEALLENVTTERDALLLKVEGYDHDRKTDRQRADEASETIKIAKDRMRDLDHAKANLSRIQDKVWKDTLDFAMENRGRPATIPTVTVGDLAAAVSAVRSIVGQP
jgi:hypothetical protein